MLTANTLPDNPDGFTAVLRPAVNASTKYTPKGRGKVTEQKAVCRTSKQQTHHAGTNFPDHFILTVISAQTYTGHCCLYAWPYTLLYVTYSNAC